MIGHYDGQTDQKDSKLRGDAPDGRDNGRLHPVG